LTDESPTNPDASPVPLTPEERPTDPAPPAWFTQAIGGEVPLADAGWTSGAGWIDNLKHNGVPGTVSVLFSYAGSTRANHLHQQDSHALYVVSGRVEYYEMALDDVGKPCKPQVFGPRQMFFTPPRRPHAMFFPVDTVMVSMSDRTRTHEEHEADVVRMKVI